MTLSTELEALAGKASNAMDVRVEVALFKPNSVYSAVRANAAGTKVIYTDHAGNEVTCWAQEWSHPTVAPTIIAALKAQEERDADL